MDYPAHGGVVIGGAAGAGAFGTSIHKVEDMKRYYRRHVGRTPHREQSSWATFRVYDNFVGKEQLLWINSKR